MELLCRIRDIYRVIYDFEEAFYTNYGIKLNEGMLICSLHKMGECCSGQIAEQLGLTLSNASKVILSAERKGLVERFIGKEDKRQMFFRLTEKGIECNAVIHCDSTEMTQLLHVIKEI